MNTHNICFCGEIRKIFTGYPPLSRSVLKGIHHLRDGLPNTMAIVSYRQKYVYKVLVDCACEEKV